MKDTGQIRGIVPHYHLEIPSWDLAIDSLAEFMSRNEAEMVLKGACNENQLEAPVNELDMLVKVFRILSRKPGEVSIVGKSLVVRALTYKLLIASSKD